MNTKTTIRNVSIVLGVLWTGNIVINFVKDLIEGPLNSFGIFWGGLIALGLILSVVIPLWFVNWLIAFIIRRSSRPNTI